jgi:hypothetical protein
MDETPTQPDVSPRISWVHLRRALLLFAIVLALAAVAASVSRPRDEGGEPTMPPAAQPGETGGEPTVSPGPEPPDPGTVELTFQAWRDQRRRLEARQPATVLVEVDEPGQVELPDFGLSDSAEPFTPASFDVFTSEPGRYRVLFTPAEGDEAETAGTLVVTSVAR